MSCIKRKKLLRREALKNSEPKIDLPEPVIVKEPEPFVFLPDPEPVDVPEISPGVPGDTEEGPLMDKSVSRKPVVKKKSYKQKQE